MLNRAAQTETSVPGSAWIASLQLQNFRNYLQLHLDSDARHVVLWGENGGGKTNILEAVSLLSPGRGLRGAGYDVLCRRGAAEGVGAAWTVAAQVYCDGERIRLGTGQHGAKAPQARRRRVRINAEDATAQTLLDYIRILWLTPAMDGLFTGAASVRRRFVDRLVLTLDPGHTARILAFERALRQRNRLLEAGTGDAVWLDGLEVQLAETGVAIAAARLETISCLREEIALMNGPDQAFPWAGIGMQGRLEEALASTSAVDVESRYQTILREARAVDRAAGRTREGPHRSDFCVVHGPKNVPAHLCSTGEQKALLVGLILAHAQLIGKIANRPPVLLLDEIAAHLDAHRRKALFATLNRFGCQAWMTGTEPEVFAPLADTAQGFIVNAGVVERVDGV